MIVKKGMFDVQFAWMTKPYNAWEIDLDGEKLFVIKSDVNERAIVYINVDTSAEGLSELFKDFENPNPTVTWTTPLTEVPSQGGGSGITALDVYPVGAEFTTTDTTFNPMKVWGGTWTVSLAGAKRVWTRTA